MATNGEGGEANGKAGHEEHEDLKYPPPDNFLSAHVVGEAAYQQMHESSLSDPDAFWAEQAEQLYWNKKWTSPICK